VGPEFMQALRPEEIGRIDYCGDDAEKAPVRVIQPAAHGQVPLAVHPADKRQRRPQLRLPVVAVCAEEFAVAIVDRRRGKLCRMDYQLAVSVGKHECAHVWCVNDDLAQTSMQLSGRREPIPSRRSLRVLRGSAKNGIDGVRRSQRLFSQDLGQSEQMPLRQLRHLFPGAPQVERGASEDRHHRQRAETEHQMAQAPRAPRRRRRSACMLVRLGGILLQIVSSSLPRQYRRDCPATSRIIWKSQVPGRRRCRRRDLSTWYDENQRQGRAHDPYLPYRLYGRKSMRQAQPRFAARVHLLKDYFGIAEMAIDLGEHEGRQVSPHFEMSSLARNPMRRTSRPCVQGEDMNVGEICSRVVVVAESKTPVQQGAKLMRDQHIGALVVTEGSAEARRPIGIVTDRDMVVEVVAADVDYRMLTV